LAGYAEWKSTMSSEACLSLEVMIQEVSLSVPSYPVQWTRYNSLQEPCQLSILESRILEISNSRSSSTMIGGVGVETQSGIRFRVAGSNIEMWNTSVQCRELSRVRITLDQEILALSHSVTTYG